MICSISLAWVINLAFSATLLKIVLLDSLIRLSESFLMMYRSGGRSQGPGGSVSPEVPRISDLAELRPRGLLLGRYALCVVG